MSDVCERAKKEEHALKNAVIKKLVEQGKSTGRKRKRRKKEIKESVEHIHQRSLNDKEAFVSASSHLQFVEGAPCAVFVVGICMNVKCMHERRKEFANLTSD